MNADQLFALVGSTNLDSTLIDALKANGGSIDELSPRKLKELTVDFVHLADKGVALSFIPREFFAKDYHEPAGTGPFAVNTVFYYPNGSDKVSPYQGRVPFADTPVRTREEALAAFGPPDTTDEEDGEIFWDLWSKEGQLIQVEYDQNLAVNFVAVGIPKRA